jgi:hypothetical protein
MDISKIDSLGFRRIACEAMREVAKQYELGNAIFRIQPDDPRMCFPIQKGEGVCDVRFYPISEKRHSASVLVDLNHQTAEVIVENVYDIIRSQHVKYFDDSPGGEHEHLADGIHMRVDIRKAIERALNLAGVPARKRNSPIIHRKPNVIRALR